MGKSNTFFLKGVKQFFLDKGFKKIRGSGHFCFWRGRKKLGGMGGVGGKGGRTNERPGNDHMTSGPMRGLGNNCTRWRGHTPH